MAITCSAEFKALWLQKQGKADHQRLAYKRRFKKDGVWQNEAEWGYLERPDFVGIGEIPQQVDLDGQNIVKVTGVTLRMANVLNEWREALAGPSFWKATDAMPDGARAYKTIWAVQEGIRLNSTGEIEWITTFTGLGLRPRITGAGAEAQIEVRSYALLLEKADAEAVCEEPGIENCIPPTGDGSRTEFESTSTGVDHAKFLTVNDAASPPNAVDQEQGSGYRVSNDNEVPSAGNTGRMLFTLASAPASGRAVKTSVVRWLQNKAIEYVLGLLADVGGILSDMRTIIPFSFPGGVSGSQTIDTQAEWLAFATAVNAALSAAPGSAQRKWFLIDDFADGNFTANPVWTAHRSESPFPRVLSGVFQLGAITTGVRVSTPWTRATGMLSISLGQGKNSILAHTNRWYFMADAGAAVTNGYFIEWGDDGSASIGKVLAGVESTLSTFTAWTGAVGGDTATWRVTRSDDGEINVYKDGALKASAFDEDITSSTVMVFDCQNRVGTTALDDVYWSPELDGVGATSTADTELTFIFNLLSAPTANGILEVLEDLNGGTTLVKTAGADDAGTSPPSPGTFDPLVERDAGGVMQHTPKQWLKIYLKITPNGFDSPVVHRMIARFTTTDVFLSLANHRGKKCLQQMEDYVRLADYEMRFRADGTLYIGPKNQESAPVAELDQENGIVDIGDEDTGIPDRVVRAGRVRYQGFVSVYGDEEAGVSASVQADGEELGSDAEDEDLGGTLVANDLEIGDARARLIWEHGRRAADDPRPPRRLPVDGWDIPWVEVSDRLRLTFTDHPRLLAFQANDELVRVDDYLHAGAPESVIANALDFKILYYNPNKDTGRARYLLEEIPA